MIETGSSLRLGIVGCGWISDWHGRAAALTDGAEIVACCDTRRQAAEEWRDRYDNCRTAYTDINAMLAEEQLDGVILATWPPHHRDQIFACLNAGIRAVLCEKSLTVSAEDALEVLDAALNTSALVVEGFMYRHHPAMREVDRILGAGELGVLDSVTAAFDFFDPEEPAPDEPRDWRQRQDLHGGVPFDLLCYCVNAANHVAGALPREVQALSRRSDRYGTVNRLYGLIEYENGVVGCVTSSKKSDFNYTLRINGAIGNLVLPLAWTPNALPPRLQVDKTEFTELLVSHGTGAPFQYETTRVQVSGADPYLEQMRDFVTAVRDGKPAQPSLAESVLNVYTINALLTSAAERLPAQVELPGNVRAHFDGAKLA